MVEESLEQEAHMTAGTRCVVLVGTGGAAPGPLLAGLSRREVSCVVVAEPARVMVELARRAAGALIVVDPARREGLAELLAAVGAYHPRTVRWGYGPTDAPDAAQLHKLNGHVTAADGLPDADQADADGGNPRYIVPDPKSPLGRAQSQIPRERVRSLVVKLDGPTDADEPLISEEELAMLLGPSPDEQGGLP